MAKVGHLYPPRSLPRLRTSKVGSPVGGTSEAKKNKQQAYVLGLCDSTPKSYLIDPLHRLPEEELDFPAVLTGRKVRSRCLRRPGIGLTGPLKYTR